MAGRKLVVSMASMAVGLWIACWPVLGAAGEMGTPAPRATADKSAPSLGPPTGQELMDIVRGSAVLRQAVQKAALRMGLDPNELLAASAEFGPGPQLGDLVQAVPTYPLAPFDWDKGVWLTFARPVAAATWPPTEFALLTFERVHWMYGHIVQAENTRELARWLPSFGAAIMHEGSVHIWFQPPTDSLCLIAICLANSPESAQEMKIGVHGESNAKVLGVDVKGSKVVAIVRVHVWYPPSQLSYQNKGPRIAVTPHQPESFWAVDRVLLKRLNY